MRFQTIAAGETWSVLGRFPTGRTISCAIFNAETGAAISQASTTTAEIGATGLFHYDSDQLTTAPVVFTIIAWQMTDASTGATDEGVIAVGGHVDNVNATISSRATPAQVATELATYDGPTFAELVADGDVTQAAIAALAIPTAGQNADAVWDEARAGHVAVGTYGQFTGDAAMRGTDGANTVVPLAAAADLAEHDATQVAINALNNLSGAQAATAIWGALRSAHVGVGSLGNAMSLLLNFLASRGLINTATTPWQEVRYVFDEASAGDATPFEVYELYDQAGTAIAGNSAAGNNPLADPTRIIAERRRV